MKFWLRFSADALAIFLGLYLLDSVAGGSFKMREVWVAVLLALILGLMNSFIRPLRRVRRRPSRAVSETILVGLLNALILQIFVWAGAPLTAKSFAWILVAAAFSSLLAGVINWLVGFKSGEKARPPERESAESRSRNEPARTPRTRP